MHTIYGVTPDANTVWKSERYIFMVHFQKFTQHKVDADHKVVPEWGARGEKNTSYYNQTMLYMLVIFHR